MEEFFEQNFLMIITHSFIKMSCPEKNLSEWVCWYYCSSSQLSGDAGPSQFGGQHSFHCFAERLVKLVTLRCRSVRLTVSNTRLDRNIYSEMGASFILSIAILSSRSLAQVLLSHLVLMAVSNFAHDFVKSYTPSVNFPM